MGVNKGAKTLCHLLFLAMADVATIVRGIYQHQESVDDGLIMSMPIAGDSNNICHRVGVKSDTKSFPVGQFYNNWAHYGIEVVPLVGGDVRPICNQATNECMYRQKGRYPYCDT